MRELWDTWEASEMIERPSLIETALLSELSAEIPEVDVIVGGVGKCPLIFVRGPRRWVGWFMYLFDQLRNRHRLPAWPDRQQVG